MNWILPSCLVLSASWINPHFIYTHGYGLVLAEVSKLTPDGQPVYLIEDMPPDSEDRPA